MIPRVLLGSEVIIASDGRIHKYIIVNSTLIGARLHHLSYHSPLGRALLGRTIGDKFVMKQLGDDKEIEIKEIR